MHKIRDKSRRINETIEKIQIIAFVFEIKNLFSSKKKIKIDKKINDYKLNNQNKILLDIEENIFII